MKYIMPLMISSLIFFSCQKKTTDESETIDQPVSSETYPNADTLDADLAKSVITWVGSKPTGQHDGTISLAEGNLIVVGQQLVGGKVIIDITSLKVMDINPKESSHKKLQDHLLSDDFFDVGTFPKGLFEITGVSVYDSSYQFDRKVEFPSKYKPASAESFMVSSPNQIIRGNLTLKGVTKTIDFPAKVEVKDNKISIEGQFNINRTDWNLSHSDEANIVDKAKDKFIYNTVNTGFFVEATIPSK